MTTHALLETDELLVALDRLGTTLTRVRRAAGQGLAPEVDRELQAHLRSLRATLGTDGGTLIEDVVDAARRVLEAADPSAPLKVLAMTEHTLTALVQRQRGVATTLPSAA